MFRVAHENGVVLHAAQNRDQMRNEQVPILYARRYVMHCRLYISAIYQHDDTRKKTNMKRIIFLFVATCMLFNFANAQFTERNAIYATAEANAGNYFGVDLNVNYVLDQKYSFRMGYTLNARKPKSQPEDFTSGLTGILVFGMDSPLDKLENFGVSVGRIYNLNKSGSIRINFSVGVGYTLYTEPENWDKIDDSPLSVSKNYSYDYATHKTASLLINPKIEFPFTPVYGLTLSPMLQINRDRTYIGIGIGSMIGWLK